jgi:type I restriction enzyme S subunit
LADAPNGVQKLRELILQLAVQGKLVPQDPNDEPAEVLLEKIEAEKKRLMKEGKVKKSKNLPPVEVDEIPYELPDSWEWCYLQEISGHIVDGTHHTPTYLENGIPFISAKDIINGQISFENCKRIPESQYQELIKRCNPQKGDILLTKSGTIGRVSIVKTEQKFTLNSLYLKVLL